ncbi:hypothetical protein HDU96_006570 [Phlyctochytrium bullatum]|nr:hypothetical protein HDU96_006570 [Phlyctochytrium bullatum]
MSSKPLPAPPPGPPPPPLDWSLERTDSELESHPYEHAHLEQDRPPSDHDDWSEEEEDPTFYDNNFWREPIPDVDLPVGASTLSRSRRRKTKRGNTVRTLEGAVSAAAVENEEQKVVTTEAAVNPAVTGTTVVHVHHYYHHHIVTPASPPQIAQPQPVAEPIPPPKPEPADEKKTALVPFEDSWITKEERDKILQQRELEARDRALDAERRRVRDLERTVFEQKVQLLELRSTPPVSPTRDPPAAAPHRTAALVVHQPPPPAPIAQPVVVNLNIDPSALLPQHVVSPPPPPRTVVVIQNTTPSATAAPAVAPIVESITTRTVQTAVLSAPVSMSPHRPPPPQPSQPSTPHAGLTPWLTSVASSVGLRFPGSPRRPPHPPHPPHPVPESPSRRAFESPVRPALLPASPARFDGRAGDYIVPSRPATAPPSAQASDATLSLQESLDDLLGSLHPDKRGSRSAAPTPAVSVSTLRQRVASLLTMSAEGGGGGAPTDPATVAAGHKGPAKEVVGIDASRIAKLVLKLFSPYTVALNAQGLMIALIFFNIVDLLVTFVKAYPKTLWFFWNVKEWDPLVRVYSIWGVIADHELLTDIAPVLINVILKIYSYRLDEIVANPNASSTILSTKVTLNNVTDPKIYNYVQLILFGITALYIILFHAVRLLRVLAFEKKAPFLAALVVLKALLLCWDIMTNSLLLYETLVSRGTQLFAPNHTVNLVLSVAIPSPLVTLTTNVLLNLPLHYFFLRMQLNGLAEQAAKAGAAKGNEAAETAKEIVNVPWTRVAWTAMRKTFHPLISAVFGSYAIYALIALLYILTDLKYFDPQAGLKGNAGLFLPNSSFFGWSTTSDVALDVSAVNATVAATADRRNVLAGIVWINVVANYGVGALAGVAYWVFGVVLPGALGGVRGMRWFSRRVARAGTDGSA